MPYPITHLEIHVSDVERAKKFYGDLFGWTFQDWDMGGGAKYVGILTKDGEKGINGGFVMRKGPQPEEGAPVNSFVCTMEITEPVETLLEKIVAAGGSVAHPTMPIPGMGWLGYGKDPDGNIFGLIKDDKEAK